MPGITNKTLGILKTIWLWANKLLLLSYASWVFPAILLLEIFQWSLHDSKSAQASRTFLSILADLNNAMVCTVLSLSLIFKSTSLFPKLLGTVPSVPITIGISNIFMCHIFFSSLARSKCLSIFSLPFSFTQLSIRKVNSTRSQVIFFLLINSRSGLLTGIWYLNWVCILNSQRILWVPFSRTNSGLC